MAVFILGGINLPLPKKSFTSKRLQVLSEHSLNIQLTHLYIPPYLDAAAPRG